MGRVSTYMFSSWLPRGAWTEMHGYKQRNPEEALAMLNCSANGDGYLDLKKKSANRLDFEVVSKKCLHVN